MKILRQSDYRLMPWKNGAGTTTEIAIYPEDAGLKGVFLWRLSIADVAADGPFSRFEGYDRHLMMIDGSGMTIDASDKGIFVLDRRFEPVRFSGDWNVSGRLHDGPVRDFNLMVWRVFANSNLEVREIASRTRLEGINGVRLIHVLEGDLLVDGHVAGVGETLFIDANEHVMIAGLDVAARVAVSTIIRRAGA